MKFSLAMKMGYQISLVQLDGPRKIFFKRFSKNSVMKINSHGNRRKNSVMKINSHGNRRKNSVMKINSHGNRREVH